MKNELFPLDVSRMKRLINDLKELRANPNEIAEINSEVEYFLEEWSKIRENFKQSKAKEVLSEFRNAYEKEVKPLQSNSAYRKLNFEKIEKLIQHINSY